MKDLINKAVSLGLGLAVTSKEQVEKLVDELVKKGEVSKAESSAFIDELLDKGKEAQRKIETIVRERVADIVGSRQLATKEDIERLERRLDALERRNGASASADGQAAEAVEQENGNG